MEISDSMYRILKTAARIKIQRGEDCQEVLNSYAVKVSTSQLERMKRELTKEGYYFE